MENSSNFSKKRKEEEELEGGSIARKALHEAVSRLPSKPTEKLPMEYVKALPMVVGVGTALMLSAIFSYVPELGNNLINSVDHFTRKTSELVDYSTLSASAAISGFSDQIRFDKRSNSDEVLEKRGTVYSGRSRLQNRKKEEFGSFSESLNTISNKAGVLFSVDTSNSSNKEEVELILVEDNEVEDEGRITIFNIDTKEYSCSRVKNGVATMTPGRCEI